MINFGTWYYPSWQKGAVSNFNGQPRGDLPRKIDIDKIPDQELQDILLIHDLTPRKYLGFKTPPGPPAAAPPGHQILIQRGRCTSILNPRGGRIAPESRRCPT